MPAAKTKSGPVNHGPRLILADEPRPAVEFFIVLRVLTANKANCPIAPVDTACGQQRDAVAIPALSVDVQLHVPVRTEPVQERQSARGALEVLHAAGCKIALVPACADEELPFGCDKVVCVGVTLERLPVEREAHRGIPIIKLQRRMEHPPHIVVEFQECVAVLIRTHEAVAKHALPETSDRSGKINLAPIHAMLIEPRRD